jgi:ubiquinone/menaquinone biosynthesis C-methylase UbiE
VAEVTTDVVYTMGRNDAETKRLMRQATLLEPFTRALFHEAGIVPGMKVLDVGSGAGEVAMLAARMVGPSGQVVGVDTNSEVLHTARARCTEAGLANVTFLDGDARSVVVDNDFDAVVGRFVLLYVPSPEDTLAGRLRTLVKDADVPILLTGFVTAWARLPLPEAT